MVPEEYHLHLAAIVDSSDDAIVSKDLRGVVRSWNTGAQRIFGYTAEEMVGRPIMTLVPSDRRDEETDILAKIARGERVEHFRTKRVHKDGRLLDISVTVSPIKDATGTVIGASKIARDITEYNRVVRERERIYELSRAMTEVTDIHSLVQSITDAVTDLSGAEFGAFFYNVKNAQQESYMLYTLSGVARSNFDQFPMPRNTDVFAATFNGEGVVRSVDITQDPRYGKNAPYYGMPPGHLAVRSYLAVPVFGHDHQVLGGLFCGHSRAGVFDEHAEAVATAIAGHAGISLENARLQKESTENAEMFQQLANSIPQLAWMANPDGEVFWYNDRWFEYTGTALEGQRGWGWQSMVDPAELPQVVASWTKSLSTGEAWEHTFPIRRHDGLFRWHLTRARPYRDSAGKIVYWFGTNTDITEHRRFAEEREQLLDAERAARSEAERVSRMKDEFLATLSHELRTPLNAILGWSQLIQARDQSASTIQEGLEVIERNARAQTQLIEDLLDMSRIVSGKVRLDVQRVDLAAVVGAAYESIRPSAEARGLKLIKILDPLAGPVAGDPNRLQQVVWNLLSNAVKFTPKGGKVEVLLQRVNSHLEISVTDTGQGIKAEFLPHVFERFRQADSSTTRQYGGLGVGLAIVKQLIELHGGSVHANSAGEGLGSTFSVSIPLAITKHDAEKRQHPRGAPSGYPLAADQISLQGITVLVVDDEPDARELLRRLLVERHAVVIVAESANQALELLKQQKPDLLLSDIGMPHKDGYEFIREVRGLSAEEGGRVPAIALTAFARSEDRTRAMIAGYQVHLSKPVEPHELVATLASLTGRTGN